MGTGTGMRTLDNICGETSVLPTPTAVPQGAKAGWPVAGAMGDGQRGSTGRFGGGAVACSVLPLPVPRPSHPPLPSLLPPSATSHGRPGSLGSPPQPAPKNTVWFCLRGVPLPWKRDIRAGGPAPASAAWLLWPLCLTFSPKALNPARRPHPLPESPSLHLLLFPKCSNTHILSRCILTLCLALWVPGRPPLPLLHPPGAGGQPGPPPGLPQSWEAER